MRRIYLAASWRNEHHYPILLLLRNNGHQVYDFKNPFPGNTGFAWKEIALEKPCTAQNYRKAILEHPIAAQGFMNDFRAMRWADTCVLLLPSGRSAHLELGWMAGAGKRTIIYTRDGEEPELMALLADHIVVNAQELLEALK